MMKERGASVEEMAVWASGEHWELTWSALEEQLGAQSLSRNINCGGRGVGR